MKIVAFNGTHKQKSSNTEVLVENFLLGAKDAGAETESVRLISKRINPCLACKACWTKESVKCVIDDDMKHLIKLFIEADIVVFACPVYADNITGIMKTFIDRLMPIGDPHWELDSNGESRHCMKYDKPFGLIAISNCGYPEQSHFSVLRTFYRRFCRNSQMTLCGEIYRGAGAFLTMQTPEFSKLVTNYLKLVQQAGREVVLGKKISNDLSKKLEAPWIDDPEFNSQFLCKVNELADRM